MNLNSPFILEFPCIGCGQNGQYSQFRGTRYTNIYTHTHTLYTNSSRCSIVYRGYVHGIAILKGTTKARQDRISTWFCQFYFAVWSRNRHCDHCDSWIFIDRIYNQVLLVEFSRQLQYWRFIFESFSILSIFRLPDMID